MKFKGLKSLTVALEYYDRDTARTANQLKYAVNLDNARSVFRFDCPNKECVRGDFDLTEIVAQAVAQHRTEVSGELVCQGWSSRDAIGKTHCPNTLHYKLNLAYGRAKCK